MQTNLRVRLGAAVRGLLARLPFFKKAVQNRADSAPPTPEISESLIYACLLETACPKDTFLVLEEPTQLEKIEPNAGWVAVVDEAPSITPARWAIFAQANRTPHRPKLTPPPPLQKGEAEQGSTSLSSSEERGEVRPHAYITQAEIHELFLHGASNAWRTLHAHYPGARRIITLARPGISPDGTYAIGYLGLMDDNRAGAGDIYTLRWRGGRWQVAERAVVWRA